MLAFWRPLVLGQFMFEINIPLQEGRAKIRGPHYYETRPPRSVTLMLNSQLSIAGLPRPSHTGTHDADEMSYIWLTWEFRSGIFY